MTDGGILRAAPRSACIALGLDVTNGADELAYDVLADPPETLRVEPRPETFGERVARFLRSSAVGILATIIDYAVLEVCVRVLHVDTSLAKIPALTCGTLTQFIGSRYYAFRAQRGKLGRQLKWFVFAEFCAFWLTVLVFRVMVRWIQIPMEIANGISGSLVYFGFSYPIWKRVFTLRSDELAHANAAVAMTGEREQRARVSRSVAG